MRVSRGLPQLKGAAISLMGSVAAAAKRSGSGTFWPLRHELHAMLGQHDAGARQPHKIDHCIRHRASGVLPAIPLICDRRRTMTMDAGGSSTGGVSG